MFANRARLHVDLDQRRGEEAAAWERLGLDVAQIAVRERAQPLEPAGGTRRRLQHLRGEDRVGSLNGRELGLVALGLVFGASAFADKPEIDPTYANGQTVSMIGPHLIVNARVTNPNWYAHSEELCLLSYPVGTGGPITLPSGYQPQCNPCFHPGLPAPFVYHDHVVTGALGLGTSGTAGEFEGPWKIIVLAYNPDYANSPSFTPIKSADDIAAAEAAGVPAHQREPRRRSKPLRSGHRQRADLPCCLVARLTIEKEEQ